MDFLFNARIQCAWCDDRNKDDSRKRYCDNCYLHRNTDAHRGIYWYCGLCRSMKLNPKNQMYCDDCTDAINAVEAHTAELEEKVRALEEKVHTLETHIAASPGEDLYLEAEKRWNETYHK